MRRGRTRHGRTGEPRLDRPIGWGELALVSGATLLVPVVLWAITYPLLAAGVGALAVGAYVLARVGARLVRESTGSETDGTSETDGAGGQAAD